MQPQKVTKKSRLIRVIEAYRKAKNVTAFTTQAAADWAIQNGLYPVPDRSATAEACERWETRFNQVTGS